MDYLQLLFSLFNAPLFAVFVLGMFTTWATPTAGFCGLLFGVAVAAAHNLAVRYGAIPYGSQMLANFYGAIYGWVSCVLVVTVVSRFTKQPGLANLDGITYFTQDRTARLPRGSLLLAAFVLAACVILNVVFR
jgi:SSS family solute:Na+ symporter